MTKVAGPGPSVGEILGLYPAPFRPISAPIALGNAGGLSGASLWRFEAEVGPLALRAWPIDGPDSRAIARIQDWLRDLAPLDFIPVPIPALDGRTLLAADARLWELACWHPGVADPSRPPPDGRLAAAGVGLASIHLRLGKYATDRPSPGLLARLDESNGWLRDGLSRLDQALKPSPDQPVNAPARRWCSLARDGLSRLAERLRRESPSRLTVQPVIRDARPEHFLYEGDCLSGVVDFGAMGIDSPAADLARFLSEGVGPNTRARGVLLDAYAAVRPIGPAETLAIGLFIESAAWLGPARWIRWQFFDRRAFDDPDAFPRGLSRAMDRLFEHISFRP